MRASSAALRKVLKGSATVIVIVPRPIGGGDKEKHLC